MKQLALLLILAISAPVFAIDGPAKGYDYKKHYKKVKRYRNKSRREGNICTQYPSYK
jgi:hypothetical protein